MYETDHWYVTCIDVRTAELGVALMQSIRVETATECQRASGSQFITVTLRGPDGVTVLELTIQAAKELAELLSRHLQ
jgi:hypothetical protein